MSNSLLPERSIQFSPSLAAAVGVECAILLQHLQLLVETSPGVASIDNSNSTKAAFLQISYELLETQLPFWNVKTIRRIMHELCELGMLELSKQVQAANENFGVSLSTGQTERENTKRDRPPESVESSLSGASKITQHWAPETAALELLAQNGIPQDFIRALVPEFTFYWRERNEASHAWSSKFVQHTIRRWQSHQQESSNTAKQTSEAINKSWQPSEDALEILERMGINRNFIVDAIPEFILYWQERNEPMGTWNSKFVAHTKRQWARFTHTLKNDSEPRVIQADWRPNTDVMEVLALANIDSSFAASLVPEFVVYWRERGELHHSWGTKFLQYVKQKWSYNHKTKNGEQNLVDSNEKNRPAASGNKTRNRSLSEDLFDRSWAN